MNDLEQAVRRTLSARVSHLTDQQLDADLPVPTSSRRRPRLVVLPLAAAAAVVAAVVVGGTLAANSHNAAHPATTATRPATPTTEPATTTMPPPTAATEAALVDDSWLLESITQRGRTTPVPAKFIAALDFNGKVVAGRAQCTSFYARVVVNGSTMRIGKLNTNEIVCVHTGRALEQQVLAALGSIDQWAISQGKLRLVGADGTTLVYRLDPAISVLAQGHRGRGTYRLLLERYDQHPSLLWQWRPNGPVPGTVAEGGIASPDAQLQPTCSRADSGAGFVYGWTTTAARRVVYGTAHPIELTLYPASTTGTQIGFGGFVSPARAHTPVTVYGSDGQVLARGQIRAATNASGSTC